MNHSFDGQIVAVVDEALWDDTAPALLRDKVFFAAGSDALRAMPGTVSRLMDKADPPVFLPSWQQDFRRSIGGLAADAQITEIFLRGRMRMSLLIDCPGGINLVYDCYRKLADYIKKRGGQVDVYVRDNAQSNGANLFRLGQYRSTLPKSSFLWHTPVLQAKMTSDPGYWARRLREAADEEHQSFTRFLLESCRPEYRSGIKGRIENAAQDPSNDRRAVCFRGSELYEFGVAHELHGDVDSMKRSFSERIGQSHELDKGHPIEAFFHSSKNETPDKGSLRLI